jgi:hypothetical protein
MDKAVSLRCAARACNLGQRCNLRQSRRLPHSIFPGKLKLPTACGCALERRKAAGIARIYPMKHFPEGRTLAKPRAGCQSTRSLVPCLSSFDSLVPCLSSFDNIPVQLVLQSIFGIHVDFFEGVQGGFFLRKKPLECPVSVYSNSEML